MFEGTDELTEACVRVTGDLGAGQTAILDIISSPGSALGICYTMSMMRYALIVMVAVFS